MLALYLVERGGRGRLALIPGLRETLYAYSLFTLGRLHCERANWAVAAAHFGEIIRITEANGDALMAAYAQRELGAVYQAAGQFSAAQQEYQAALQRFAQMEIADEVARTKARLQDLPLSLPVNA